MQPTTSLELLAPAGNAEIGMAAIDHGADAVYIGAPRFSARAAAGNAVEEIEKLIQYAHLYYAKVYVALNTILTDNELAAALDLIQRMHAIQADGLIIQDPGLLELDLPPIPLIASTQMHNDTPEKVKFLEDTGFQRVILARELSLEEIRAIRRRTRVELEVFVHGSLCVSYSGQCYLSQALGGRSGNRGVCAQPCRSRYSLWDGHGKIVRRDQYLLSLKDLNLAGAIPDLVESGVTSFKIEGRYKEIDYVKNITACYRQVIDQFIAHRPGYRRGSSGTVALTFTPDPEKTFNRGYTSYFLHDGNQKPASIHTPKSMGKRIGVVKAVGKEFFEIAGGEVSNGDGLCFLQAGKELVGFRVDRVFEGRIFPGSMQGIAPGTVLYRNHDHGFVRLLKKKSACRRIGVFMGFFQNESRIVLEVIDEDGNRYRTSLEIPFEAAREPLAVREQMEERLSRIGDTPYRITRLTIDPEQPGFVPASRINQLRREAIAGLTEVRLRQYPRRISPLARNTVPYPETVLDYRANVLNAHARRFYARHGVRIQEPAFEVLADPAGKTVMTARYCIRHQLDACLRRHRASRTLQEPLTLKDAQRSFRLHFDCDRCRMRIVLNK
ncbi:MAG: peptidase U32 family protein [Thermodesulfobacteriota bacterium]